VFCPACGEQTKILFTRLTVGGARKRRRECLACEVRFTSVERVTSILKAKIIKEILTEEEAPKTALDLSNLWR